MDLKIPKGIVGTQLKTLMYDFVSYLSNLNEERDKAEFARNRQRNIVDAIKDIALQYISHDEELKKKTDSIKKSHIHTYIVKHPATKEPTTLFEEKEKLALLELDYSVANSKVRQLETLIQVCRSGLSFDKSELNLQ